MLRILAIADDLSGAAETAAALLGGSSHLTESCAQSAHSLPLKQGTDDGGPQVRLLPHGPEDLAAAVACLPWAAATLVLDTDNRAFPADVAADRLRLILGALPSGDAAPLVFLKLDSLLRGPVARQLEVLAEGGPVLLAPALPAMGRSTVNGMVHHGGVPLHRTPLWDAEPTAAPESVAATLAPLDTTLISLAAVRSGTPALTALLMAASAGHPAAVIVCDAETTADLDLIARAARGIPGLRLAGASALGAALARTAGHTPEARAAVVRSPKARQDAKAPLLVVGSASGPAREQLHALAAGGVPVITFAPQDLLAGNPSTAALETALRAGPAAVTVAAANVDPVASARIAGALARTVAPFAKDRPLMLTGGETARHVLAALGVQQLLVLGEIEHGAVLSRTPAGMPVVTRPGSFGSRDSLRTILAALDGSPEPSAAEDPSPAALPLPTAPQPSLPPEGHFMNNTDSAELPYVAVTMGDGAGVGPEVVVAAVLDPQSNAECRPVVVGDALRLRQAAEVLGIEADIQVITDVEDAVFTPGRVNVIDLALLPEDLPWGQLSPVAGHAAYEYIRVASELAMAGKVQAICTAPLNKEALHAAGHIFPGHTELLAQLTGTEEVSMMLSTPKIKVIHVTTHIGLMDAVRKINPDLVERTIRRGNEALIRAGIPNPKIGVCAINPHAGENGLFGQGEEAEKIEPGVKAAQAAGINAVGPLPADTLFFLAGRGDYDLVVAMYHDQGHGPVKVLGIEAGVNITVGLPVIRTSVDHGTAFDIAGKAIADPRSMVEALHQAAEMATRPAVAV
ncbi:4-hydroxythreonine-4-phosphate dehydrogenase [Arthrobacter sp. ZBG10]|uniref:4-hydroxythreonine-4-phosphate dehydrogenase PdxA n=1 Tax=Arthrobacter sp. ZBG10 TaxID=1676590 RepID=UPI0006820E17|nr:4-hydroxythreonine-4-phosphate dehydrogenase PdxA [Arthrobacter sp. ZBG10]KNH17562.1 4-hydroxythreonine-4-phosphate dehydrogenase [Arthrobacter sp. ZBG10]